MRMNQVLQLLCRRKIFSLWQYLNQPLFQPTAKLIWSPVEFWQSDRIQFLEYCLHQDQIQFLERCWNTTCTIEENIFNRDLNHVKHAQQG